MFNYNLMRYFPNSMELDIISEEIEPYSKFKNLILFFTYNYNSTALQHYLLVLTTLQ